MKKKQKPIMDLVGTLSFIVLLNLFLICVLFGVVSSISTYLFLLITLVLIVSHVWFLWGEKAK